MDHLNFISRCTVPEERLPSDWKERTYCPGWFHTGDTRQDVTLMVCAVTYDPICRFSTRLVPRKEEDYLGNSKES
jgi:hypothetical protein